MENRQEFLKKIMEHTFTITPCSQCSGERVVAWSSSYLVKLTPDTRPGYQTTPVYALVCIRCGHATYYAQEPEKLYKEE